MKLTLKTILSFLACLAVVSLAAAELPTQYKEIKNVPVGEGLNGIFYIDDDSTNYNIWYDNGKFYIDNPTGATDKTLKIKYNALENKFGNGAKQLKIEHKNDVGVIDSEKTITIGDPDFQGFVYITGLDFSTIILSGRLATITKTCTGLSNTSWCNLTTPTNATSITVNISDISLYFKRDDFENDLADDWTTTNSPVIYNSTADYWEGSQSMKIGVTTQI